MALGRGYMRPNTERENVCALITGKFSGHVQMNSPPFRPLRYNSINACAKTVVPIVFSDLIIEGPSKWVVRPVAEFFYEEEFGRAHTLSGLIGAIWQVNDFGM
jgi:hypothetical protein